ncbi:hypothetical protein PPERSA_11655 [Pseudocohnilembus persalinus]|uniref:Uncharacterized protein n=1 Tax=Pseudocohnilembus persalinus TaxID=266149 RepID=A0A0V0QA11_PSEPJ|nr:hypothetical protein PPERSA_11655 [Pseudocohnilembus persalinus]|eukprot:KRW99054.1 hypothetical protein PPERSA_11655 [Pseudocohnilembus persalinus]
MSYYPQQTQNQQTNQNNHFHYQDQQAQQARNLQYQAELNRQQQFQLKFDKLQEKYNNLDNNEQIQKQTQLTKTQKLWQENSFGETGTINYEEYNSHLYNTAFNSSYGRFYNNTKY